MAVLRGVCCLSMVPVGTQSRLERLSSYSVGIVSTKLQSHDQSVDGYINRPWPLRPLLSGDGKRNRHRCIRCREQGKGFASNFQFDFDTFLI